MPLVSRKPGADDSRGGYLVCNPGFLKQALSEEARKEARRVGAIDLLDLRRQARALTAEPRREISRNSLTA